MPISAPNPYSKPSAKRVLAFTITLAESTSRKNRCAWPWSLVMMASVWWLLKVLMWAMASSRPATTLMLMMGARYSVAQSASVARDVAAPATGASSASAAASQRISTPLAA